MQVDIRNEEQKASLFKAGGWWTIAKFTLEPDEETALHGPLQHEQTALTQFFAGPKRKWHVFNEDERPTFRDFARLCCSGREGEIAQFATSAAQVPSNEKYLLDVLTLIKLKLQATPPTTKTKRYKI